MSDTAITLKPKPIWLTHAQSEIVLQAVLLIRKDCQQLNMPVGRCLELICADYLSGH